MPPSTVNLWSRFRQVAAAASLTLGVTAGLAAQQADLDKIDLAADQITYDANTGIVRAIGRVLLRRDGYTLEAGEILYNEKTGAAEAFGAVTLTTPSGDRIFSPTHEA